MTEVIIFAGSDARAHAKEWSEWAGKHIAADDTPPVILGPKQLASPKTRKSSIKGAITCAFIVLVKYQRQHFYR